MRLAATPLLRAERRVINGCPRQTACVRRSALSEIFADFATRRDRIVRGAAGQSIAFLHCCMCLCLEPQTVRLAAEYGLVRRDY